MQEYFDFALRHWMLFVALLVAVGLLIGTEVMHLMRGVKNLTPGQALQLINQEDALILDLRDNGEFRSGHIPNARNIAANELASRLGEVDKFKDKPVLVYCRAGVSSSGSCALLKKSGFTRIHNLGGGLGAWQSANLPISKK